MTSRITPEMLNRVGAVTQPAPAEEEVNFDLKPENEPAPQPNETAEQPPAADPLDAFIDKMGGEKDEAPPPADSEYDEIAKQLEEKAAHAFQQLRAENKELRTATQVTEEASKALSENEELRKQLEDIQEKYKREFYLASDEFRNQFDGKAQSGLSEMKKIAKAVGADPEMIDRLSTMETASRIAAINDHPHLATIQPTLIQGLAEMDKLSIEKKIAIENWREHAEAGKDSIAAKLAAERKSGATKQIDEILQVVKDSGRIMFQSGISNEWDAAGNSLAMTAKAVLTKGDQSEIAQAVLNGVAAKPLEELFLKENLARKKAEAELMRLTGGRSPLGAGGASETSIGKSTIPEKATPRDLAKLATRKRRERS